VRPEAGGTRVRTSPAPTTSIGHGFGSTRRLSRSPCRRLEQFARGADSRTRQGGFSPWTTRPSRELAATRAQAPGATVWSGPACRGRFPCVGLDRVGRSTAREVRITRGFATAARAGRIGMAVVGVGVALLIVPPTAPAITLRPASHCRGSGGVTDDRQWETSAPFLISISRHTATAIARRAGYFEAHPVTEPRFVPCAVAESVAFDGMQAWDNRAGGDGWVGVSLGVATGRPYLGRFYCTGEPTNSGGAVETCNHRANMHAGRIVVRFRIEPASS
jgi:hypothetical protein